MNLTISSPVTLGRPPGEGVHTARILAGHTAVSVRPGLFVHPEKVEVFAMRCFDGLLITVVIQFVKRLPIETATV